MQKTKDELYDNKVKKCQCDIKAPFFVYRPDLEKFVKKCSGCGKLLTTTLYEAKD